MCDDVPTLILTTSAHIELILPFTPRRALRSSMAATPTLSRTPEAGTISIRHYDKSRDRYALARRLSPTEFHCPSHNSILRRCKKALLKLLRMEHLRAFSNLVLVNFPQSRNEASALL
jgi:hypothetical protein